MDYANDTLGFTSFKTPDEYLCLDDSSVISSLLSLKDAEDARLKIAYEFCDMYRNRQLLKMHV
jgi:hypothetical protein